MSTENRTPPGGESERDETVRLARTAGTIGIFTLASRVLGFIRDMAVARLIGASWMADAFYVAFRIPNMLRELLAEGSMSAAFVPVFTEKLTNDSREAAWDLASRVFTLLLAVLVGVTCLGILLAPLLVRIMAPGFADGDGAQQQMTILLTRIMFPYLAMVGLAALAMGVLNSLHAFALPAVSPLCFNLALIVASLWVAPHLQNPVVGLAGGVVVGGLCQLAIQIPGLIRHRMVPRLVWDPRHEGVRRILRLMMPMMFGLSVTQVNLVVGTLMASFLVEGAVSYLYYGMRLIQFPLGVFGVALATAVLPNLSRRVAAQDMEGLAREVTQALRLVFFITVPAMAGLIALRVPIVRVLFERGAFDAQDTHGVAVTLMAYSTGLWAFAGVRIIASAFYALQDTRTPVRVAALAMLANIALNLALMKPLAYGGLALATALASMLNIALLLMLLRQRLPQLRLAATASSLVRTGVAALIMGVGCAWLAAQPVWSGANRWEQGGVLGLALAVAIVCYLGVHRLLGGNEVSILLEVLRRRRRRPTEGG